MFNKKIKFLSNQVGTSMVQLSMYIALSGTVTGTVLESFSNTNEGIKLRESGESVYQAVEFDSIAFCTALYPNGTAANTERNINLNTISSLGRNLSNFLAPGQTGSVIIPPLLATGSDGVQIARATIVINKPGQNISHSVPVNLAVRTNGAQVVNDTDCGMVSIEGRYDEFCRINGGSLHLGVNDRVHRCAMRVQAGNSANSYLNFTTEDALNFTASTASVSVFNTIMLDLYLNITNQPFRTMIDAFTLDPASTTDMQGSIGTDLRDSISQMINHTNALNTLWGARNAMAIALWPFASYHNQPLIAAPDRFEIWQNPIAQGSVGMVTDFANGSSLRSPLMYQDSDGDSYADAGTGIVPIPPPAP